jgi:uncharacterized protein (DUF1330 family)
MSQPAYFILEIDIHDAEGMKPYLAKAGATLMPFAATTLVNGGAIDTLEGEAPRGKVVVLRFASMAQAQAWYASPAYREVLGHRLSAASNRAYFVEGL